MWTRTRALSDLDAVIASLVAALYARHPYTAEHSERVSYMSLLLAQEADLPEPDRESIRLGALLHDIGKIGTPDSVLMNPGKLTDEQIMIMQIHPYIGRTILTSVEGLPRMVLEIVHFHHERMDGRGYPAGLRAMQIPRSARLVAVADAWDAMTSTRAYRAPLSWDEASNEIVMGAGTQFDPELASLFLTRIVPRLADEMKAGWPFRTSMPQSASDF